MLKSCLGRDSTLAENWKMCGMMKEMVMKSRRYRAQEMLKRKALIAVETTWRLLTVNGLSTSYTEIKDLSKEKVRTRRLEASGGLGERRCSG